MTLNAPSGFAKASSRKHRGQPRMTGLRAAFEGNRSPRNSIQASPAGLPVHEIRFSIDRSSRAAVSPKRTNASVSNWMKRLISNPGSTAKSVAEAAFISANRDRNENSVSRMEGRGRNGRGRVMGRLDEYDRRPCQRRPRRSTLDCDAPPRNYWNEPPCTALLIESNKKGRRLCGNSLPVT